MRGTDELNAMRTIFGLQALRVDAARSELTVADQLLSSAVDLTRDGQKRRGEALEGWYNALECSRPDPGFLKHAGDWLVAREARLKIAELDQGIAQARRDNKAVALAETTALHEIAVELTARLHRRDAKTREEQLQQTSDDLYRMRRFACPLR